MGGYGKLQYTPLKLILDVCSFPFLGVSMSDKDCYIDENDNFQCNERNMLKWYESAMKHIEEYKLPMEDIPFVVFLLGCEAALRCQQKEKVH